MPAEIITVTHVPSRSLGYRLEKCALEIRELRSEEHQDCECCLCQLGHAIESYFPERAS